MKILVINGSPKGKYSITLQTSRFLEIKYPDHKFEFIDAGQKIKSIEKDFSSSKEKLENADLIIFSYPVYTFIAPSQLHKFISLMKSNNANVAGKWVTQISTSKHFYDITAHRYIEQNCYDMGMRYVRGLSADMDDLTKESGQKDACRFFEYLLWCINNNISEFTKFNSEIYESQIASVPQNIEPASDGDIVILTDTDGNNHSLNKMIERFEKVSPRKTRVVNLQSFNMKGGCLGCFNCAVSGECVYKDGFSEILRNDLQKAEAIVYAFTVTDHSMGPLFKMYDDRQFVNGHRSVTMGMPVGYLVSGQYSAENNLQMIIEGRSEVGGNYLCGVATDELDTDVEIDKLANRLKYAIDNKFTAPANFLGVGGMKIFRDLVYQMRGMMKADHRFYKEHDLYDFPQKHKIMSMAMYLVGGMLGSDKIRSKMGNKMNEGMLMPYAKIIEDAKKNK